MARRISAVTHRESENFRLGTRFFGGRCGPPAHHPPRSPKARDRGHPQLDKMLHETRATRRLTLLVECSSVKLQLVMWVLWYKAEWTQRWVLAERYWGRQEGNWEPDLPRLLTERIQKQSQRHQQQQNLVLDTEVAWRNKQRRRSILRSNSKSRQM